MSNSTHIQEESNEPRRCLELCINDVNSNHQYNSLNATKPSNFSVNFTVYNMDREILPPTYDAYVKSNSMDYGAELTLELWVKGAISIYYGAEIPLYDDQQRNQGSQRPAKESEIAALKRVRVEEMGIKDDEEYCCSVCLDDMAKQKDAQVTCMPCKHGFHGDCILKWLKTSSICPLCRFDLRSMVF